MKIKPHLIELVRVRMSMRVYANFCISVGGTLMLKKVGNKYPIKIPHNS